MYAILAVDTRVLLQNNLKQSGETGAGFSAKSANDPLSIITTIIQVALSLLGIVFLVLTVYGGYLWMTSAGNDQQVQKAKDTLKAGVIGLAITLSAYIISVNVLQYFMKASGLAPGAPGPL